MREWGATCQDKVPHPARLSYPIYQRREGPGIIKEVLGEEEEEEEGEEEQRNRERFSDYLEMKIIS